MGQKAGQLSPTVGRIAAAAVILALAAKIVLVSMGLSYAKTLDRSLNDERTEVVIQQFQQNMLYVLNDINNLLILMQTPAYSFFFQNLMSLRDEDVVHPETNKLLGKLNALDLSSELVNAVYFIGVNGNQQSYVKKTGSPAFEELPRLRTELLQRARLESLFLPDRYQVARYGKDDFDRHVRWDHPLIDAEDAVALQSFITQLEGHPIVTNGNENGIYIVLVLDDRFFTQAMPNASGDKLLLSVESFDGRMLWSTAADSAEAVYRNASYANTVRELSPFRLRVVLSEPKNDSSRFRSALLLRMAVISLVTMIAALSLGVFLLHRMFKPFRLISRKLKSQFMLRENEMLLRPLPEHLIRKGLHSISLRNKLILVLLIAVSVPSACDGILFSRLLTQDVQLKMAAAADTLGDYSSVGIRNRARFMENQLREITATGGDPSAVPGLNEVSYFVRLDEQGNAVHASIYANSKDIFNTDPVYLQNRDDPYWISNYSNYKDVFNQISTAVVQRIGGGEGAPANYVLLAPKASVFEIAESGPIGVSYAITDREGQTIYESQARTYSNPDGLVRYSQDIPGTNWHMAADYMFNEVTEKKRLYQERFLVVLLLVFLLSSVMAVMIASFLVRPIKRLKETMQAAGAGNLDKRVLYDEDNEIGDIVKSYNRMIDQLDRSIRNNISIMEENARNKIRENELLSMKTRAELQMLQAQINPHFLYNTLEAINMRSMKSGNHEISAIVGALADLFRYSISKGSDVVPLDKELNHAANYITIQQIRFGRSFEAVFDIPEELRSARVVRFILQPLIENAVKHGFAGWETGGLVRISARAEDGRLRLTVSDNGVGMDAETLGRVQAGLDRELTEWGGEGGIGLKNVYYRLKLFYRDEMTMSVRSELMAGTEIAMAFPLSYRDGGPDRGGAADERS